MKKYIFIVPSVANMGGAQMYIRNKILYLRQNGWIVEMVLAQGGKATLSELQEFVYVIPELSFQIQCFTKKTQRRVINTIVSKIQIGAPSEVVIESTCIPESSWSEAVAKRLRAKHIVFLLQEENAVVNSGMQDYFIFKHNRKELFGITDTSLGMMFESFHPIPKERSYRLPAFCNNVEANVDSPYIDLVKGTEYDHLIGMLSRLEKPFVMPSLKDFCRFAYMHEDKKFLLLLMGDAPKGSGILAQIQDLFKNTAPNVSIIATGYLYPVPTRLLEMCDAFFTSAGSAGVCKRSGVPTITYDGNDLKPIGILGRTTKNSLFRGENEIQQDFSVLMEQILFKKKYKKETPNYAEGLPDFSSHLKALVDSSPEKEYYDVESIKPESKSDYKLKWSMAIIGPSFYLKLGFWKKRWKRGRQIGC